MNITIRNHVQKKKKEEVVPKANQSVKKKKKISLGKVQAFLFHVCMNDLRGFGINFRKFENERGKFKPP